jgi:hypothetical protein
MNMNHNQGEKTTWIHSKCWQCNSEKLKVLKQENDMVLSKKILAWKKIEGDASKLVRSVGSLHMFYCHEKQDRLQF